MAARIQLLRNVLVIVALATALPNCAACGDTNDIGAEPNPGTGGSGGTSDAKVDSQPATACPAGLPGAPLARISAPDGSYYCMDEREVTNGEYAAFLEAKNGDASGQPTECDWNTSFIPKFEEPNGDIEPHINECPKAAWNLETHPTHPVRCVDFCDAFAYCKWAGRRLCGETGATTGAVNSKSLEDVEKLALSTQSEWYNACSQGGNNTYPYGDDYVAGRCKDSARTDITNTSSNQCTGTVLGYQGIYDLSGSVEEWANFCFKDGCSIYGGSFISSNENSLTCTTFGLVHPTLTNVSVGFRCCADAIPEP